MTARPRFRPRLCFRPRLRFRQAIAVIALFPLLAACGGILPKPAQREVYRSAPAFAFSGPLRHVAAQLAVATPTTNGGLDTKRIALSRSPVSLDYFADAEWTDRAPLLVQAALVDGFAKSGAVSAVAGDAYDTHADWVVTTDIRDFEAVYDSPNATPHVKVTLDVQLIRLPERRIAARTVITRKAAVASNAMPDIVKGFDTALGGAAQDLVTWVATNPALSAKRR